MWLLTPAAFFLLLAPGAAPEAPVPPPSTAPAGTPVFRFETDEFWLNLHHFLYVLGRAEAKTRDASREAVVGAPEEAQKGLASLTEEERKAWVEAVQAYTAGPSQKDAIFDAGLIATTLALAAARDAPAPPREGVDPVVLSALERAAPAYRKAWWPAHRQGNRAWVGPMHDLLSRHGHDVFAYLLHAYGMPWPKEGYGVHLSAYANWAGAYSTRGDLLVVSTGTDKTRGLHGLEIVFHESMHQWDDPMDALLERLAKPLGKPVPKSFSHALVFYTAGEAVKHAVPQHVPYADAFKMWERGLQPFKAALDAHWKPYLQGKGTRDEALTAVLTALPAPQETTAQPR
jgi:hypothetical protein